MKYIKDFTHWNSKFKLILGIFLFLTQIYFILLNGWFKSIWPESVIKYTWHPVIWIVISLIIALTFGKNLFKIYPNLIRKQLSMDTLLGISAHTLFLFSLVNFLAHINDDMYTYKVFWEATGLLIIFSFIGKTLEQNLRNRSIDGYKQLLKLRSKQVIILNKNQQVPIAINQVQINDVIVIKSGQNVPLDGILLNDEAIIDSSNITGESKLKKFFLQQELISGTKNVGKLFTMKVTRDINNSTISKIIDKMEDLNLLKPKIQLIVDKLLKYFIPTIFFLSFFTFSFWLIIGYTTNWNLPWFKNGNSAFANAMIASMSVLAIACPCSLGIAAPLIISISSSLANKSSLLFTNPKAFEKIKHIKVIAFDKTGTLTTGKMKVVYVEGEQKYLQIASAIEKHSIHPVANAISNYIKTNINVNRVIEIINQGIEGWYQDDYYAIMKSKKTPKIEGATTVVISKNNQEVATINVIDEIKLNSQKTIAKLQAMNIKVIMITGDTENVAQNVAHQLNIKEYYANVDPIGKAKIITKINQDLHNHHIKGKKMFQSLFIGDGLNDILALQTANISAAFASGSNIVNSNVDVSILNEDLYSIIKLIQISKWNQKCVILSLIWAFLFNWLALPIAFLILIEPWMAAIIMIGSELTILINGLIYKLKAEQKLGIKKKKRRNILKRNW